MQKIAGDDHTAAFTTDNSTGKKLTQEHSGQTATGAGKQKPRGGRDETRCQKQKAELFTGDLT